jgi:hypothetical protein
LDQIVTEEFLMSSTTVADQSVAERVRRILEDMAFIRASLVAGDGRTGPCAPPLELQMAAELKSGVDAMRHLLWLYMKARCAGVGAAQSIRFHVCAADLVRRRPFSLPAGVVF